MKLEIASNWISILAPKIPVRLYNLGWSAQVTSKMVIEEGATKRELDQHQPMLLRLVWPGRQRTGCCNSQQENRSLKKDCSKKADASTNFSASSKLRNATDAGDTTQLRFAHDLSDAHGAGLSSTRYPIANRSLQGLSITKGHIPKLSLAVWQGRLGLAARRCNAQKPVFSDPLAKLLGRICLNSQTGG